MTYTIDLEERPITHYIGVPLSSRLSEFGAPGGPNQTVPKVYEWLAEREITPRGGPLYIYRHFGEANEDPEVELTVAVSIAEPVKPSGEFVLGNLPGGSYVVCRYTGHPDGFSAMQPKVRAWAESHQVRLAAVAHEDDMSWTGYAEHYVTDPNEEPDFSKWTTELLFKTT